MTSPYRRIAEDIQKKIVRGELRVGDRLPSTREIARRWKVALATAAHALRVLGDDGLVRTVPRVGTLVASPRPRPRIVGRTDLARERIVEVAVGIADAEGLAALSLRSVAAKVGAPVMSLYRHVASKDELLRLMTDDALGEEALPERPPAGWRAQLALGAHAEWRTFRRHPWLARVVHLSRPEPLPNAMRYADWMFRALAATGARPATQLRMHVILHAFVQGLAVNVEAEAEAASETGVSDREWMDAKGRAFEALAASGRYPAFGKLLRTVGEFDLDLDDVFERGLAALLDGFAAQLAR